MAEENHKVCQTCGGDPERHDMICKGTKPNPDRLAGLTEEERELYEWELQGNEHPASRDRLRANALESLAAARASEARKWELLKKHRYAKDDDGDKYCIECGGYKKYGCEPNCALAAELRGGGGNNV